MGEFVDSNRPHLRLWDESVWHVKKIARKSFWEHLPPRLNANQSIHTGKELPRLHQANHALQRQSQYSDRLFERKLGNHKRQHSPYLLQIWHAILLNRHFFVPKLGKFYPKVLWTFYPSQWKHNLGIRGMGWHVIFCQAFLTWYTSLKWDSLWWNFVH